MAFTFFFRDLQTLDLVREHVVPQIIGRCHIDIWDAGCAHGPEPYSLAIVIRESMGPLCFRNVRLTASDLDDCDTFGPIVTAATYPYDEIKRIPDDLLARYFQPPRDGSAQWTIRDELRQRVSFVKHDLLSLQAPRRGFCLILCKNVLLHFRDEQRVAVLRMFHDALDEGGYLVTEQTQGLPVELTPFFAPVTPHARIYRKLARVATPVS